MEGRLVILAGGISSRMKNSITSDETKNESKSMIRLGQADRPFLDYLLMNAERAGYSIKEVGVAWSNRDESDTKSQKGDLARYLNESMQMGREVIRVKLNQLKGLYDEI